MNNILKSATLASAFSLIIVPLAQAQNTAEYSLGATGEQFHTSALTTRQTQTQRRTSPVTLRNARYALEAPSTFDQSSYPSGAYSYGFSGGGGSSRFSALPVVSTASVDINSVDLGKKSTSSSPNVSPQSTNTLPPATRTDTPFDLSSILSSPGLKLPELPTIPTIPTNLPGLPAGLPSGLPEVIPQLPNVLPGNVLSAVPGTPGLPNIPNFPNFPSKLPVGIPKLPDSFGGMLLGGTPQASGMPTNPTAVVRNLGSGF